MTRLLLLLCLLLGFGTAAFGQEAQPRPPRIAVVSIHLASNPDLARAAARRVANVVSVDLFGLEAGRLPSIEGVDLGAYDLVLVDAAGPAWLAQMEQVEAIKARTLVAVVGGGTPITGNVDPAMHPDLARYWDNATEANYAGLFAYLAGKVLERDVVPPPPVVHPRLALWHPAAQAPFVTIGEYLDWAAGHLPDAQQRPRVGILFYRSLVLAGNDRVIRAMVAEVERQGGLPVPIWREGGSDLASAVLGGEQLDALILCGNRINYANAAEGAAEAKRLGVPPLGCSTDVARDPESWRRDIGGFAPALTGTLAIGETEGIVEPMIVGARAETPGGQIADVPIEEQVRWRVARAMKWARLHRLPNAEKRVAITYHSEDGSEADIGSDPDSYLDAQASIVALLHRLRDEGYDVGEEPIPDRDALARRMAIVGSNVPPGDEAGLTRRIAAGAISIDAATYARWYSALPGSVRAAVEAQWGPPPGDRMTTADGRIVIPALRFGNVVLAAHPTWGMDDARALEGTGALPPHHQYLAFYLWMQREGRIDAYLPLFTQLSLMPGKQQGPAADDPVALLIGDLPHISPLPLQANGGVGNKRRTYAVTVGFMPEFRRAGLSPEIAALAEMLAASPVDEPAVRSAAAQAGLAETLGLDPAQAEWSSLRAELAVYLAEAEGAPMPVGGHVLGQAPNASELPALVHAMLAANGSEAVELDAVTSALLGDDAALPADELARAREYAARINAAPQELDAIIDALAGRFVAPGPNGDALRNPEALPGGRNPYTLDIRAMPSRDAWETGIRLADQLIETHRTRTGSLPRKVAFVLWSGEAVQNGGTSEAQILRLLGVRPVWNAREQIVDVTLDDRASLGRGRIDVLVTTSGTYRDNFGGLLALIAKAVRLAAEADEPDNAVRSAVAKQRAVLVASGVSQEKASRRALRRVFSTAPGAYSPSTQFAVREGWDPQRMNRLYEARLGHAFDNGAGEADPEAFAANLADVDAAVFARSSTAYGLLDTPLPAAYLGGLAASVRERTGRTIASYVANGQDPGAARVETLERFYGREKDSRYLNPRWIEAMQASGYNGTRYMADLGDSMLLWDVNMPDLVPDRDWEAVRDVYLRDRYGLGLARFFEQHNPAARRKLAETMLAAVERGVWRADAETVAELQRATRTGSSAAALDDVGEQALAGTTAPRGQGPSDQAGEPAAHADGAQAADSTQGSTSEVISGFELAVRETSSPASMVPRSTGWALAVVLLLTVALAAAGSARAPRW